MPAGEWRVLRDGELTALIVLVVQAVLSGLAIDRLTGYYRENLSHPHTSLTLAFLVVALILVLVGALTTYARTPKRSDRSMSSAAA